MPLMPDGASSSSQMNPDYDDLELENYMDNYDVEEVIEIDDPFAPILDSDDEEEQQNESMMDDQPLKDDADLVFTKHTGAVFCCHIDPKTSQLAVTGSQDDKAYVWNINNGEVVFECDNHIDSVIAAEFSYNGTYLATGDMSGNIKVWNVFKKTVVWNEIIAGDLSWLKWHHSSAILFASCASGEVYMWKIPNGELKVFPSHGVSSGCSVIMPDGLRGAFGYSDGSMRVYDLKSSATLAALPTGLCHYSTINCIDSHPDNNLVVLGGGEGKVTLYKTQSAKVVNVLDPVNLVVGNQGFGDPHRMPFIEDIKFCKDPNLPYVAAGTLTGRLHIWDIEKKILRNDILLGAGVSRVEWDKNSNGIYVGLLDGSVKIYDGRSNTMKTLLQGHNDSILDFSLSTDGGVLLTASEDYTARVFKMC